MSLGFDYAGHAVLVSEGSDGRLGLSACPLQTLLDPEAPLHGMFSSVGHHPIALIYPKVGEPMSAARIERAVARIEAGARRADIAVTTYLAPGAVRFWCWANGTWIDEPETDPMPNAELDRLMRLFVPARSLPHTRIRHAPNVLRKRWCQALEDTLAGKRPEVPDGLDIGAVRDEVIIWAVSSRTTPRLEQHLAYEPPRRGPKAERVRAALTLLGRATRGEEGGHALACAAYLAWWSGYRRLALHLSYTVRAHQLRTRLADLVLLAVNQEVDPPWMG